MLGKDCLKHRRNRFLIMTCILILLIIGCSPKAVIPPESDKGPTDLEILSLMFTDTSFVQDTEGFRDQDGKLYTIKEIVEDSFILESRLEKLVIIEITEGLSHAEGFYQVYLVVFNVSGRDFLSTIKSFSADEGQIALFKGKDKTYVLFVGNTTFNGWTNWTGGLWEAGQEWTLKWPENGDYWENRAVEIEEDGLKVFERRIHPPVNQLIPDYEWEYSYRLTWDQITASFK